MSETENLVELVEPIRGFASWTVGFVDMGDGPDVLNAPRLTGLAAFRDARRRCLKQLADMAGPAYPIKVHHTTYSREQVAFRREPVITMTVFSITTHRRLGA